MKRLWDNIEAIGAVVMALAAVIALVYAHVQITEGRDAERERALGERCLMVWLWDNSVTLATITMGIAAVVALIYAHLQISDARRAERRANANELWRETLRLAFDNPKLSDPSLKTTNFDYENLAIDGDPELFQKYEMYLDTVLNASEDILEGLPTPEWYAAVRLQLKAHRDYLLSPHFRNSGYLAQYTPKFRAYMDDVLSESDHA